MVLRFLAHSAQRQLQQRSSLIVEKKIVYSINVESISIADHESNCSNNCCNWRHHDSRGARDLALFKGARLAALFGLFREHLVIVSAATRRTDTLEVTRLAVALGRRCRCFLSAAGQTGGAIHCDACQIATELRLRAIETAANLKARIFDGLLQLVNLFAAAGRVCNFCQTRRLGLLAAAQNLEVVAALL